MQIKRSYKNIFIVLLTLCILLSLAAIAMPVRAVDVNGDGIDDDIGLADKSGASAGYFYWNGYNTEWGVRVTMVDNNGNRVSSPIDYTNAKYISTISGGVIAMEDVRHFGRLCKTDYRKNGWTISDYKSTIYKCYIPPTAKDESGTTLSLPCVINGTTYGIDRAKIVNYFSNTDIIKSYISKAGSITYQQVLDNHYEFLVEPLIYLTVYTDSKWRAYAFTPTEIALYAESKGIPGKFGSANIRSWAKSLFLDYSDIGFNAYKTYSDFSRFEGAGDGAIIGDDYTTIKKYLGMLTILFNDYTPSTNIVKIYYHKYDINGNQIGRAIYVSNFDLGSEPTKQFRPVDSYGTPVAACVEKSFPSLKWYPHAAYRVRQVGDPDKTTKLTSSLTIYSSDVSNNYTIHVKVIDTPVIPTTIKVYYHLYNSSDVQTSLKTSTFDLATSSTKQFTPSTAYGTPVAACVENNPPSTNSYPFTPYRVREVGDPDSKSKLTATLTVTSSDVSNNYTIHVKVIDTVPPPATVKVPVYYYYYDGYGNQTSCSSSVESYVELNKTNWRYF